MEPFAILPITREEAFGLIEHCRCYATGPRVCLPLYPDSPATEAVFLDDLAGVLIRAGKARRVTSGEACRILARYPDNPLVLSRVSGRYMEICRSEPSVCIYWKMRRRGLSV